MKTLYSYYKVQDQRHFPKDVSVEMKLLTRNFTFNLTKSATKCLPKGVTYQTRNYRKQRPTQKLLWFPAFPLEPTIKKYLKTVEPFLSKDELDETKKQARKFVEGCGSELQCLLEQASKKSSNWLAERWLKTAYLQYRDPVMIYSSPGMTFPHNIFCSDQEFCDYTAKLIYGMLKYKETIDEHKIPIVKMSDKELDNSQFYKVFGTCRIPIPKEDKLSFCSDSKHIVIICKNRFYKLKVYTKNDQILHPEVICGQLMTIWCEEGYGCPIGILSADNRDDWAKAYSQLKCIGKNEHHLKIIQNALFTVSLDQSVPIEHSVNSNEVVSEQLIHGGGSKQNSSNRWFDKTIQVIVNRNGVNGFCYEHSPAEGQPIALMDDFVVETLKKKEDFYEDAATNDCEPFEELKFETSPSIAFAVERATENVNKLAANLHMKVLHYKGYGKEFLKTQKLSPDSFCQMAMQYAFYKQYKVPAAQYESAHLRIYTDGRTETIRSCSTESVAFSKAMVESKDDVFRSKLLRRAVEGHQEYAKMALQGQGVDRHLLGLKLMAIENKMEVPDFFQSTAFKRSTHFRMSTSQVASKNKAFMCYGPSTSDGYGCCYNPRSNDIYFAISSWRDNHETNSDVFHDSLQSALDDMMCVLSTAGTPPKPKL